MLLDGTAAAAPSEWIMADKDAPAAGPKPEHRAAAAGQFERARQVIATGNFDYGIELLRTCCKLDPGNLPYRQMLRQTEMTKYNNNKYGSRLALLTTSGSKAKILAAKRAGDYLKVLEYGEEALVRNPWDTGVLLDMAEAAEHAGLLDVAVWTLEQARLKDPNQATVNKALARLYEKRGNFNQAIGLWELVRKSNPKDAEARNKAKDIAASATIARGGYGGVAPGGKVGSSPRLPVQRPEPAADAGSTEPPAASAEGTPTPEATNPPDSQAPPLSRATSDRYSQEAAALQARIANDPTIVNHYLQLAGLYRRSRKFDQAKAVLEQGLGPTGNSFELTSELVDLAIEPFRVDLAILEEKVRAHPEDQELRHNRDRFVKEVNTRELEWYRLKADRFPTEKSLRFELGVRLFRAGQLDEAIRELQNIRSDPRHTWRALLHLGYCFSSRNNWRLAQRNFEEALKALPGGEDAARKEILFQLAKGCADAGDFTQALELGYELANLDFGFGDIGRLLDEWQTRSEKANVSGQV
jgi:tetratricopeptide (TPR) repeat protein